MDALLRERADSAKAQRPEQGDALGQAGAEMDFNEFSDPQESDLYRVPEDAEAPTLNRS